MHHPLSEPHPWNEVAPGFDLYASLFFGQFASHAADLLDLPKGSSVLDVACGAGSLTALMAKAQHRVTAVDFAERMLDRCRARLTREDLQADVQHMDGQQLALEDHSFDAVASMFGWMFFPDRARGLTEFQRVLKPGGVLVVSSWAPISESPLMQLVMGAVNELTQTPPAASGEQADALEDPNNLASELFAAGFDDVQLVRSTRGFEVADLDALWEGASKSSAPLVMLRQQLGEELWQQRVPKAKSYLAQACPPLPAELCATAWIATARKPAH